MSRRALWAPTMAQDRDGEAKPESATVPDIRAPAATGRDVGAVLERIAVLEEQLAQAHRELSGILQNRLAVVGERALMCPVPSTLLTVEDLAQRLGVTARTIRRWRLAGKIPRGIELGDSVIRWPADVIDRFLAEGGAA
jgi:predicted DNA-binding transcriptional regulator AlpA